MDKLEFAAKAKYMMEKKRITISQISKELGISIAYISDIIKGNRQGGKYRKQIAAILGFEQVI